jgi:hypothetical protein
VNRAHRNVKITVDVVVALLCAAASVVVLVDADSPVRPALVLVALVVGTGWAATCWIDLDDVAFAATVALGTGLAGLFLYGLFFVEIGWWHPVGSAGVLLAVAAAVCVAAIARDATRETVR